MTLKNLHFKKLSHNITNVVNLGASWWNFTPKIKEIWPGVPLAYIMASIVKLSLFLTTELLFLYVDCRLCLSLGAINIYQDQLYILELRKMYLTTLMALKKPLQSHREKGEKRPRHGKESEEKFFSFSLTNSYHSIFSPNCAFFPFFF